MKKLLANVNLIIAMVYAGLACYLIWRQFSGNTSLIGAAVLASISAALCYGHFRMRPWAIKVTAVVSGVVSAFSFFYLVPGFDRDQLPSFSERAAKVLAIVLVSAMLIYNYYLSVVRRSADTDGK